VIDEADADRDAFRRAVDLGYAGVSVKACKGVFRALANRGLVEIRRAAGDGRCFQSGEDLTNLGSIPLQQDLALQATIGVPDVERNGHHYFRGLDHLPESTATRLARELPGLYVTSHGMTRLRVDEGRLDLRGVVDGVGFGGILGPLDSTD
ncbi:MAG: mandelate racemase, partial [Planctomycetia bacterium]|nr:mandelate racemase [Planctomycetia bacterium]